MTEKLNQAFVFGAHALAVRQHRANGVTMTLQPPITGALVFPIKKADALNWFSFGNGNVFGRKDDLIIRAFTELVMNSVRNRNGTTLS